MFHPFRYGYPSSEDGSTDGSGVLGGPAEEYLEEEEDPTEQGCWVPPELSYLLNSFYMFGHFDKAIFLELCKSIQTVPVPAGQYLFRIGDPDEFVHVVQSGKMNVHIVDSDNR